MNQIAAEIYFCGYIVNGFKFLEDVHVYDIQFVFHGGIDSSGYDPDRNILNGDGNNEGQQKYQDKKI